MGFDAILAQEPAVQTLVHALEAGRVHHAYRFEGPPGVGKEMAALALAQALVCEAGGPIACERCSACRRAVTFSQEEPRVPLHPDVIFVQRGLYAKSVIGASEATGISVEQVRRVVLGRCGFGPHEARALVFIVRDADELTVQAANALLKTLEEPEPATHFVLLTSRPNRLLDTVRSRTLAVRFGPLPDEVVARILQRRGAAPSAATLAQGSASLALELSEAENAETREAFIRRALEAIDAPDLATAIDLMETRSVGRDELRGQLSFLAQALALGGRQAAGPAPERAEREARRYREVIQAMSELERNAQPALVLESMLLRLRRI